MRINVHDFSGHPFQVQLSRELAARGHEVEHTYCAQYVTGRGRLDVLASDPPTLRITALRAATPLHKYEARPRIRFELGYARAWRTFRAGRQFDATIACNLPLLSQARAQLSLQRRHEPWILWHQDIYSQAIIEELRRRYPGAAPLLAPLVVRLERRQVRTADHVVAISDSFVDKYAAWGLAATHVSVIPNWAPLDDIRPTTRDNLWAREVGLPADGLRLLYSGTLGRKHNPLLLVQLLDALAARGRDATLTVCSEGVGADDLIRAATARTDVRVLGFQPAERLAEVLSSADLTIALLETDASNYSVPSKVLSYLAGGRAVVGFMPAGNPAASDIVNAGGHVSAPTPAGVEDAARWIDTTVNDQLAARGRQARTYAEERFDISTVADRFERLLHDVARPRRR